MNVKKIKIYAKMSGIGLLVLAILIFMASNREQVTVKFLGWEIWQAPLFAFIGAVASLGIVTYLIVKRLKTVIKEYSEYRNEEKTRKKLVDKVKKDVQNSTTK